MRTIINVSLVLALLSGSGAAAQPSQAAIDLAAAIRSETIDGDLDAAIQQYATIAETSDRAIAAEALIRMGGAYEKLGKPEALEVYQQVLREYPDQAEPVATARTQLAALEVGPTPASPALHTELVWDSGTWVGPYGSVSPDGTLMTFTDYESDGGDLSGNLAIHNLATGESRRLTHTADNGAYEASSSHVSPDGTQVVYQWFREVRLLTLEGDQTEPRTVWSAGDGSYARPQDWFPSGDHVAAVVDNGANSSIVTVSMLDGVDDPVRQVLSIDWGPSPQVRVSRDGRYLAYSRSESRDLPEMDIFLVAVDGSSNIPLVQHAANDELVAWSPDGTQLLFNSDRSGQAGLWAQRVQDAEPVGEPQLLIPNLNVGPGLGITSDGTLHYAVQINRQRLKIAELDMKTGELLSDPVNVTERFVGSNFGGQFSPDGETLAYFSERRGWQQQTLVIESLRTGAEWDSPFTLELSGPAPPVWRLDEARLMVHGLEDRGRRGPLDIDVASGQIRPLTDLPARMWAPVFTPDGTHILHRNGTEDWEALYSYSVADGSVSAVPGDFGGGVFFSLSPNGRRIALLDADNDYARSINQLTEIRLQPVSGGDGDVLWTTDDDEPFGQQTAWTPDGTALLVLKRDLKAGDDMSRLWVVPVDGSEPVATELVLEGSPGLGIHPDGRRIVYREGGTSVQFWALHNLALRDQPASR